MTINAVIFDIDDTLVDNLGAGERALARFHRELKLVDRISAKDFRQSWMDAIEIYFDKYLQGEMTIVEQRVVRVRTVFGAIGIDMDDEQALKFSEDFIAEYERNWEAFDDVVPCLEALAGCKLGVITNGDSEQQRRKLASTKLAPYFSSIVISGELGVAKPHPEIFQTSLRQLGAEPHQAAYVGDDPKKDVIGAKGVGVCSVFVDRRGRYQGQDHGQDFYVDDLATVASLLRSR